MLSGSRGTAIGSTSYEVSTGQMLPSLHMLPLGSPEYLTVNEETSGEIERLLCDRDIEELPSLAALNPTPISAPKRERSGLEKKTPSQFKNAYIDWRNIDSNEKTVASTLQPDIFDQWAACCLYAQGFDFWIKRSYGVMNQPVEWDASWFFKPSNAHRLIAALLLLNDIEADELVGLDLREIPEWESSWRFQLANHKIRRLLIELFLNMSSVKHESNILRDLNIEAAIHHMPYFASSGPALMARTEAAKEVFYENMIDLMDIVGARARTLLDAAFETLGVSVSGRLTVYRGDERTSSNNQSYYRPLQNREHIPRPNLDKWLDDYSKSVVSTTMSKKSIFFDSSNDTCCKFKIDVVDGVKFLYLTGDYPFALVPKRYGGFTDEQEVLLPKGLFYKSHGSNSSGKVSNKTYYVSAHSVKTAATSAEDAVGARDGKGGGEDADEGGAARTI